MVFVVKSKECYKSMYGIGIGTGTGTGMVAGSV